MLGTPITSRVTVGRRLLRVRFGAHSLDYERYITLQNRLRAARRELLLFCEHPRTLTAGVQSRPESLLLTDAELAREGIVHLRTGRGGDYTAHEPGQTVIYPHIDLEKRGLPVAAFFQLLIDVTRESVREVWDLDTKSQPQAPGLYVRDGGKLASIGIMFKRFFTSFGVAVNVSNDLAAFQWVHPCGNPEAQVTSVVRCGGAPALRHDFEQTWERLFRSGLEAAR